LAQLQQREDVETARVDRRGELLRIRLRAGGSVGAVREALEMMGFAAETMDDTAAARRWYGASEVRELSREEAEVVASRVTPAFGAAHAMTPADVALASSLAADALYRWFVYRVDGAASGLDMASSCGRAVEAATLSLLGPDQARALGDAIEADLAGAAHG